MRECPTFDDLNALVDGDLAGERETRVQQHVERCKSCRRQVDSLLALKRAVGRAYDSEVPAPSLRRAVTAALPKRRRRRTS
ncbi:MAG TPA: zf-HC2 domain-containing protein [Candidatus Acidoferrales bacterium]|nr:zf-HC2 domain-containing protein [Candidatus Acidoferrales bacterium]